MSKQRKTAGKTATVAAHRAPRNSETDTYSVNEVAEMLAIKKTLVRRVFPLSRGRIAHEDVKQFKAHGLVGWTRYKNKQTAGKTAKNTNTANAFGKGVL